MGHTYFGITPAELDDDIRTYEDSERRGEIQPVYLDHLGSPYVILPRPDARSVRFYFFEHGYSFGRDIHRVLTKTEQA
jgi:hypothetical protein